MSTASLLVELLTEELPPKALKKLGEAFAEGIASGLRARKLMAETSVVTNYATPRRLAVHITELAGKGPDEAKREKVLPVNIALGADGKAQPPLLKKLAAMGLSEADIPKFERAMDGKAEALFHNSMVAGQSIEAALQVALDDTIKKLPIPKLMFYERDDGTAVNFVRPAHKLIALHGDNVLDVQALGLKSGNTTQGHRFHSSGDITIANADAYANTLKTQGKVMASFAERRASIEKQLQALAKGDDVIAPDALLDEVTSLVEWPVVYECHFEEQFLQVPQECLILTMQTNQKYFATQRNGKLTNRFLIVSNIETSDASYIVGGNERVVRPRLADAKFFFDQDKKHTLESRLPKLDSVVYHNKLGSQGERNQRVLAIAKEIAKQLGTDVQKAERAARLSKADLVTDMVGEFPELQGIMGEYYALHDNEDTEVAKAIKEHYMPRFAGDALPSTMTGTIVALADKLETLAGMFSIGAQPTGDKDPYALRRHALGILRLLREKKLEIRIDLLLSAALAKFAQLDAAKSSDATNALMTFLYERLSGQLREEGYSILEIEAVLAEKPQNILAIGDRLVAVRAFSKRPEAPALAESNKRIANILKKASEKYHDSESYNKLQLPAERELVDLMNIRIPDANRLYDEGKFSDSLIIYADFKAPLSNYFDQVMVLVEDSELRLNRLATLKRLHTAMNRVADLSKLAA